MIRDGERWDSRCVTNLVPRNDGGLITSGRGGAFVGGGGGAHLLVFLSICGKYRAENIV